MLFSLQKAVCLLGFFAIVVFGQCTIYFDDCHACLSDPECGWCGDYCASKDSAVCDTKIILDASICPSADFPIKQQDRQLSATCTSKTCDECVLPGSGCLWCETTTLLGDILSQICISNTSAALCSNAYAASGTQEIIASSCPINPEVIFIIVFEGTGLDPIAIRTAMAASFDAFIASLNRGASLDFSDFIITQEQEISGTSPFGNSGGSSNALNTRVYFYGVSPDPSVYPQSLLNQDIQAWLDSLGLNTPLGGPGGPVVVGKGTSGGNTSGSSGKHHLSGGDIAGIVIGSVVGGLIILAVIAFFILRNQDGVVDPFRAAGASFH